MNTVFERINFRYRGPIERQKLMFCFNQIASNIIALSDKVNSILKNIYQIRDILKVYTVCGKSAVNDHSYDFAFQFKKINTILDEIYKELM